MLSIIFVMGFFTTLHPDAYIDGFMSIVYVYGLVFIFHVLIYLVKVTTDFDALTLPKKAVKWYQSTGVFISVAMLFTLITVINSLMMITGIDTPKTGSFAYLHLLVRTLIVIIAVGVTMYKDVLKAFKAYASYRAQPKDAKKRIRREKVSAIRQSFSQKPFESNTALFTLITVTGCIVMVLFSSFLNPEGGHDLYLALVVLYAALLVFTMAFAFFKRLKQKNALE